MQDKDFDRIERMPDTHWSLIARADNGDTVVRREALAELLEKYMVALNTHLVLEMKIPPDQARDLLQGFVTDKVLEQSVIAAADQRRGRFRNFILTALDHYVISQQRYTGAAKRNPGPILPLNPEHESITGGISPAHEFDIAWARELLNRAIEGMKANCRHMKREDVWEVFSGRILVPLFENAKQVSYEELVTRVGFESPSQASDILTTGKRMFARVLRSLIAEYEMENSVEDEICDLYRILAESGAGAGQRMRI